MTPNDTEMEVLLRRHAQHARRDAATGHLDADEMNAFAERKLPPAARARYVSHLADCDPCRQQIAQLAESSGALARAEQMASEKIQGRSLWQTIAGLFALPVLRYAAFAAVVLIVAGVALLVFRRPQEPALVAVNEPTNQAPVSAVKPSGDAAQQTNATESKQANSERSASVSQTPQGSDQPFKRDESKVAESPSQPPKPEKEAAPPISSGLAGKKTGEPTVVQRAPSYAPPPPGETTRAQVASSGQQTVGGVGSVSGPRKSEPAVDKLSAAEQERAGVVAKAARSADDNTRLAANQAASNTRRSVDEKAKGPRRDSDNAANNRSANEIRAEAPKTSTTGAANRPSTEEAPQTRSVGGRKFRRQGNAWVDQKFKSSKTLKNVSRGSDEFAALDAGLRSIANQLGGEVIVVWKGKAYLIR